MVLRQTEPAKFSGGLATLRCICQSTRRYIVDIKNRCCLRHEHCYYHSCEERQPVASYAQNYGKVDMMSYSLLVEYDRDINPAPDNYLLAASFVRYLVLAGRDPSRANDKRGVHVCAQHAGLTTVSGKPGVKPLGCAHYNPHKDVITQEYAN